MLAGMINEKDPSLKILDCSSQFTRSANDCFRVNFNREHIPGAKLLDMDTFKDMRSDLNYMMPDEKYFCDRMKILDIKLTDTVICYDTGDQQWFGYRAAWMFQAMGHPKVAVLDGGLKKWKFEGHPIESFDEDVCDSDFDYKLNADRVWNTKQIKQYEKVAN